MRIALVGADLEENLGLATLAAAVEAAGHEPIIVAFNGERETDQVVRRLVETAPEVVGLSMQFQHRAREFFAVAKRLRRGGYAGHLTVGGQFPTMAYREVLEGEHGIDSVVLHDGERTLAELLDALGGEKPLGEVAGLALCGNDGHAFRTTARRLIDDLDALPFSKRYRAHSRHLGVPFIPILGGRGCWGRCSYCSITTAYRDARCHGGGALLRLRSPEMIAAEMAVLWHAAGGRAIFCFHDDNLLLPRPEQTLSRLRAIRAALDELGVGEVGLVGKCRPETLTPELAHQLAALGVIRLYVGVENASAAGARHLARNASPTVVANALEACRSAGIFVCYNLLIFEPDATLDHVAENIAFIRDHAAAPMNFCRAEPYYGTPLHRDVAARQRLSGSYLGYNYRMEDDRAELLFRICSAAFRERNFAPDGVANRAMGLGYGAKILERFYGGPKWPALSKRAEALTRRINLDTAAYLERAMQTIAGAPSIGADEVERATALLGLEIAAADRIWHEQMDELLADLDAATAAPSVPPPEPPAQPSIKLGRLLRAVALGATVAAVWTGCDDESTAVDPAPPDGGTGTGTGVGTTGDPVPDAGTGTGTGSGAVDPAPPDGGGGAAGTGGGAAGGDGGGGGAAGAAMMSSSEEHPSRLASVTFGGAGRFTDTSAPRCVRTGDLPLQLRPEVTLCARQDGDFLRVQLATDGGPVSVRWEAQGPIVGSGPVVRWKPQGASDRLRVAVRAHGGVAVKSLSARHATRGRG